MAETKYQRGKIYKLCSDHTDEIYIGSTTQKTLAQRMGGHRKDYLKVKHHGEKRCTSWILLDYPDCRIVLLEQFPCNSKDELNAREQHYIDLHKDICVNRRKAYTGCTREEYLKAYAQEHVQKKKMYDAEYRANNAEAIKAKRALNAAENYQKRKQKDMEYHSRRIICECGVEICQAVRAKHQRTNKHLTRMNTLKFGEEIDKPNYTPECPTM